MRSVKLIATDMDETLLTSDKHVPEEFYKLVSQLDHVGVVTAIASGRPLYTLKAQFPDLPLAFIADNGGVVEFHGELIHQARLKTEDYQKMINFTLQQTAGIPILCGLNSAYIPKIFEASLNHLKYFYSEIKAVEDFENLTLAADKFTVYFPDKSSRTAYSTIFRKPFEHDYSVQVSGSEWIDFMPLGTDKGITIKYLGSALGISPDQMMAFGDAENDIPMLTVVEKSYVVANAIPEMFQYGKYKANTNDQHGVTEIMSQVLNSQGEANE